jgi:hypothetical protein
VTRFFHHVLTSYFGFSDQFFEQTDGMDVGLSLTPVITSFFMQYFEEVELVWGPHRSLCWFVYVDQPDKLRDVLDYLNSVHKNINFIMGM